MRLLNNCFIVGIVALLASCSGDDIEPGSGSSRLPILLTTGSTKTRAASNLMQGSFPSGSKITVLVDDNEYQYQTNDDGKAMTCLSESHPVFPENGNSVTIKAFYPKLEGWFSRYNKPGATFRWGILSDQSNDANYQNYDIMSGTVSDGWSGLDTNGKVKPTDEVIPLTFKHLLSKIIVNVTPTGSSSSKIKKIVLNSLFTQYRFSPSTCVVDSAYADKDNPKKDIIIYKNDDGTNASITCAAAIPPQTKASGVSFITVTMSDGTRYYQLPQATTFVSGRVYTYNIGTAVTGTNDMITLSDTLFTYNTSAQGPTITLKWGTTTLTQGTDYDFDTSSQNTATNAGTYTVKVNFKGRYCGTAQKTWKIDRINPTYTAPSTYRIDTAPTTAQNLVKAGSCSISGCTVQYSLGTASAAGTSWSSTVPQKTVAGEYYVWWRIYSTNGNYHTLNGTSPLLARIRKAPGEVICSDGTICEYSQRGSKTPVAVVVRWGSDTGNSKYTRGLAMALEDAGSAGTFKWSTEQVQRNSTSGMVENEDGSSYNGSPYNTSTYPAFQKALAYSPAAPSNTSGWFLPSSWQFNEVIWGMGSDSNTRYDTLRQLFSSRGGTNMKQSVYWTSSEKDKDNAMGFNFSSYSWYATGKTNTNYVRPMLAF